MSKTIILDVDGVLLDWRTPFIMWLNKHNILTEQPNYKDLQPYNEFNETFIKIFSETLYFQNLPPEPGAIEALNSFRSRGFTMKVLTSCTDNYRVMRSREQNLINVFGDVFEDFIFLPLQSSKKTALNKLIKLDEDSIFVEDTLNNILDAVRVGFKSSNVFLMAQLYNMDDYLRTFYTPSQDKFEPEIRRFYWDQITKEITGE